MALLEDKIHSYLDSRMNAHGGLAVGGKKHMSKHSVHMSKHSVHTLHPTHLMIHDSNGGFLGPLLGLLPSVISGISSLFHRGSGDMDGGDEGGLNDVDYELLSKYIKKTKPRLNKKPTKAYITNMHNATLQHHAKPKVVKARSAKVKAKKPKKGLSEASKEGMARNVKKVRLEMEKTGLSYRDAQRKIKGGDEMYYN